MLAKISVCYVLKFDKHTFLDGFIGNYNVYQWIVMKKTINLIALSSLLTSYSYFCSADDGEIFFNDKLAPAKPNVIFLLDVSGSMAWYPYADNTRTPPKGVSSRMDILKSSLDKVLADESATTGIRAGIVKFSGSQGISTVVPVADIDNGNQRQTLRNKAQDLKAAGGTPTVQALYDVGQYISPNTGSKGPYHATKLGSSPILEGCQLSHIILMTDGKPEGNNYGSQVASYIGAGSASNCSVVTQVNTDGSLVRTLDRTLGQSSSNYSNETCGRALTSWMSRTDQAPKLEGDNYIRTHTIGFALRNQNGTQPDRSDGKNAQNFLTDLAKYGGGKSFEANSDETLVKAFREIISDVRAADSPSASGTVTVGEQARYEQRTEVFYSLYASDAYNYWPGNMKRFKIEYVETTLFNSTKKGQRAVLVDKKGTSAMSPDGTFYNTASSFWSESDGGKVMSGGVLEQLKSPADRKIFTLQNKTEIVDLKANPTASIDLGVNDLTEKNALLNFIRGYTYNTDSNALTVADKKMGDAARGRISLATYDCITPDTSGKSDVINCLQLDQVALLASNDGFIRGYNINTGEAIYEYMPEEMLPLIQKLQRREVVSFKKPRYYGLDGKPVIYHHDKNNDHYINNGEHAYAYIASGRGGAYIYALDISSRNAIKLAWQIEGGKGSFSKLGYTWSTPMLGKMKINGEVTAVLVFGGGYDKSPQEEDTQSIRTNAKGNDLYIVNAETGNLIWSASNSNLTGNMSYSIPSAVALVTDDSEDKLVTDIIFGDMGGQVWRLSIDNAKSNSTNQLSITGKVIAQLAGSSAADERKFYQAPAVYETKINGIETLSVNIGSGFRNHPLNMVIKDRIYSLRIPKDSTTQTIITEEMLGIASSDGQSITGDLTNGFMIKLSAEGEKVITDGYANFDRLVFNTFIPFNTDKKTCVPSTGTQRTYNYDLATGKSLLKTAYISIGISALPPDVTAYCDGRYCTIISDPSLLSKEKPLPEGKDKDAFLVDTGSGTFVKTGSTDLFDISAK